MIISLLIIIVCRVEVDFKSVCILIEGPAELPKIWGARVVIESTPIYSRSLERKNYQALAISLSGIRTI